MSALDYAALREFLAKQDQNQFSLILTFQEIEAIVGGPLPDSAYESTDWWSHCRDRETPQSRALEEAGFGVAALVLGARESGWVGFGRGLHMWPGVAVDSNQFAQKPIDERLRELAIGYVQSAKSLCLLLGDNQDQLSWPRASVICFCYVHAVELFLKSCIFHRVPAIEKCSHKISVLRKQYLELYTHRDFYFETPFDVSLDDLDELFDGQGVLVEDFERNKDQVYRYMGDKKGRSPKGIYSFGLGSWFSLCQQLEADIGRVWTRISESDNEATNDDNGDQGA